MAKVEAVTVGIWTVSKGKGERYYINCKSDDDHESISETSIMHPHMLAEMNGCGMYGVSTLNDLAVAILLFEKNRLHSQSIAARMELQE